MGNYFRPLQKPHSAPKPPVPTVPKQQEKRQPTHPLSASWSLIFIVLLAAVGFSIFYASVYFSLNKQLDAIRHENNKTTVYKPSLSPTATPDPTANWKIYQNLPYHFSMKYPPNWSYDEKTPSPTDYAKQEIILSTKENGFGKIDMKIYSFDPSPKIKKPTTLGNLQGVSYISSGNLVYSARIDTFYIRVQPDTNEYDFGQQILATFSFPTSPSLTQAELNPTEAAKILPMPTASSSATCIPRPKCLDTTPRCRVPESTNMCPVEKND